MHFVQIKVKGKSVMINMRVSKDRSCKCSSCGNDLQTSVEMFDVRIQIPKQDATILHLCDKCISEMFDKSLKARCLVDGMVKSQKQISIINKRKRDEMKKKKMEE